MAAIRPEVTLFGWQDVAIQEPSSLTIAVNLSGTDTVKSTALPRDTFKLTGQRGTDRVTDRQKDRQTQTAECWAVYDALKQNLISLAHRVVTDGMTYGNDIVGFLVSWCFDHSHPQRVTVF